MSKDTKIEELRKRILSWIDKGNLRTFSWRNTNSPYEILVAEVLLQQTPAERVQPVYLEFLSKYQTLSELAEAEVSEVTSQIEELGLHNKRGEALVKNARQLVGDGVPRDKEQLENLAYVNKYGANAVLCFAFGEDRPLVDTNVVRVYSRFFNMSIDVEDYHAWEFADNVLPEERVQDFNLALLDFAATICQPQPKCSECFLSDQCSYYKEMTES